MGNQNSEMKTQFQAKPDQIAARLPDSAHQQPLPHTLRDHLNDELTKVCSGMVGRDLARGVAIFHVCIYQELGGYGMFCVYIGGYDMFCVYIGGYGMLRVFSGISDKGHFE